MAATKNRDVVDELESAAVVEVGRGLAVAHTDEAIDVDDREALLVFAERTASGTAHLETLNAERFDGEVAIGPRAQFGDVAANEAEAGFIEEISVERVDVLDGKTVVWEGGVVAEVRIEIDIGKGASGVDVMEEEKVFLREVLIQPRDALIHA